MSDDPVRDNRNMGTFIALFAIFFLAEGLLALMAMVVPQLLGINIVVGLFLAGLAFHYVTWGWWLPRYLKAAEDRAAARNDESLPPWARRRDD